MPTFSLLHVKASPHALMKTALGTACLLVCTSYANANSWHITDLGTLGGNYSRALDINNSGQIVGESATSNSSYYHPTLWHQGSIQDLNAWQPGQGAEGGGALSINNAGQIAGYTQLGNQDHTTATLWSQGAYRYLQGNDVATGINAHVQTVANSYSYGSGSPDRATQYNDGSSQDLGALGGWYQSSHAAGLNDKGQAVGQSQTVSGDYHATTWMNGNSQDLGTLGGHFSNASSINNNGEIVGYSLVAGGSYHAALWVNGVAGDIGTLQGREYSLATDINNAGQVVGYSFKSGATSFSAFLYSKSGGLADLNSLAGIANSGWVVERAYGINDKGQIVGSGLNANGEHHAFLISAAPEPETYLMMLMGLSMIARMRRRITVKKYIDSAE